ncbi:(2Fe-2S)-binding protein [Candidatus Bathyarchaeota archaeon]|jgi:carbon-monoxide dehydrogenase small subunit|nr:(2Fe-2S)-binding protein [Candidatus Bathyarchaeota archaeon]
MTQVISIKVNGVDRKVTIKDNELLLDVIRDKVGVKSVKAGCWRGECGLCTVLLDGKPVKSCLVLAVEADGREVETAEGLAPEGQLSPLQKIFVEKAAMQCGFCTPSFVLTAHYLLSVNPDPTESEIRDYLSGHICRCGTYKQIIEAILEYAKQNNQGKRARH